MSYSGVRMAKFDRLELFIMRDSNQSVVLNPIPRMIYE